MRLIIQRVKRASVTVVDSEKPIGEISKGLFILVGVRKGDTEKQAVALAEKVFKLRVMSDSQDKMNLSVIDAKGEFLVVSQFTLYADTTGGNRPSFIDAALPEEAEKIYDVFVSKLKGLAQSSSTTKRQDLRIETGSFGDYMQIFTELDGPVTIILEN